MKSFLVITLLLSFSSVFANTGSKAQFVNSISKLSAKEIINYFEKRSHALPNCSVRKHTSGNCAYTLVGPNGRQCIVRDSLVSQVNVPVVVTEMPASIPSDLVATLGTSNIATISQPVFANAIRAQISPSATADLIVSNQIRNWLNDSSNPCGNIQVPLKRTLSFANFSNSLDFYKHPINPQKVMCKTSEFSPNRFNSQTCQVESTSYFLPEKLCYKAFLRLSKFERVNKSESSQVSTVASLPALSAADLSIAVTQGAIGNLDPAITNQVADLSTAVNIANVLPVNQLAQFEYATVSDCANTAGCDIATRDTLYATVNATLNSSSANQVVVPSSIVNVASNYTGTVQAMPVEINTAVVNNTFNTINQAIEAIALDSGISVQPVPVPTQPCPMTAIEATTATVSTSNQLSM